MRQVVLSTQKGGVSRLREKGNASPETLFTLTNAYITTAKTIRARPGRTLAGTIAPGTVGLTAFDDQFYVFASVFVPQTDPNITCVVLRHPTSNVLFVTKIHFVQPFLGRLYVVAEFNDGSVFDYWMQNPPVWTANTVYQFGTQVSPTVPTGYVYQITNASTLPTWAKDTEYAVNAEVLPTTANGFKFRVTSVTGTPARSGSVEPTWPTTEGATVVEVRSG